MLIFISFFRVFLDGVKYCSLFKKGSNILTNILFFDQLGLFKSHFFYCEQNAEMALKFDWLVQWRARNFFEGEFH